MQKGNERPDDGSCPTQALTPHNNSTVGGHIPRPFSPPFTSRDGAVHEQARATWVPRSHRVGSCSWMDNRRHHRRATILCARSIHLPTSLSLSLSTKPVLSDEWMGCEWDMVQWRHMYMCVRARKPEGACLRVPVKLPRWLRNANVSPRIINDILHFYKFIYKLSLSFLSFYVSFAALNVQHRSMSRPA